MTITHINIKNKKAEFEFYLLDKFIAGIQLTGTEIKSIRAGKANITDAYCIFNHNELYVKNMHVSEYEYGTHYNHEPKRDRKLLLSKRELKKLQNKLKDQGLTIVPTSLFINEKGYAKLNIALAKGKKLHDKRDSLKLKEMVREKNRGMD